MFAISEFEPTAQAAQDLVEHATERLRAARELLKLDLYTDAVTRAYYALEMASYRTRVGKVVKIQRRYLTILLKELIACSSQRGEGVHELDAAVSKVPGVSRSDGETVDPGDRCDLSVE